MRKSILTLALAALCLCMGACSDDDPVTPEDFTVTLQVTDPAGDPVAGLRVGLVNDTPYFQDGQGAAKASTVIPFQVPVPSRVRVSIEDVTGVEIATLVDDELPAGSHRVMWNGENRARVHQPSGRYTVHLVAWQLGTGVQLFEGRTGMLLAMLDSSRVPAGYTDAEGQLLLKDKKLFPHLYNLPEMTATNENAEVMGKLTLTPLMRISLVDENGGGTMGFKRDVMGSGTLELIWDPPGKTTASGWDPSAPLFPGVAKTDTTNPELFYLRLVFPNPFN